MIGGRRPKAVPRAIGARRLFESIACLIVLGCGPANDEPELALPCDVDLALRNVCQTCHTAPPKHGALVPLMTYADTQKPFTYLPSYDKTPTWIVIGDVIEAGWMPQPWPGVSMSLGERAALLEWVNDGAPPRQEGAQCGEEDAL
jgi:hypothetical protein